MSWTAASRGLVVVVQQAAAVAASVVVWLMAADARRPVGGSIQSDVRFEVNVTTRGDKVCHFNRVTSFVTSVSSQD